MRKIIKVLFLMLTLMISIICTNTVKAEEKNTYTMLFLGTDTGVEGRTDVGRSDTIMVAKYDTTTGDFDLVSIPRDLKVDIPGHGEDKINHAYAFGGEDLSMETVDQLLDIKLDYYVRTDMQGFIQAVDAIGELNVLPPVTFTFDDKDQKDEIVETFTYTKGQEQTLNGHQALGYARERETSGGDKARQGRQRELVQDIMSVAINNDYSDSSLEDLYNDFAKSKSMNTNIPFDVVEQMYQSAKDHGLNFHLYQLNSNGKTTDAGYYEFVDQDSLNEIKMLFDK